MTNTIAPPTLEELNARIAYLEPLTGYWSSNCVRTSVDVNLELYCLRAVRDSAAIGSIRESLLELLSNSYNSGFNEGMREHTSPAGGETWSAKKQRYSAYLDKVLNSPPPRLEVDLAQSPWIMRDGVAASEQSLSEAERHAVEHARWQVRKATPDNPDCSFDYELVKNLLDVIDRKNPQSPWMDIETAPRDGTDIIVYRPTQASGERIPKVGIDYWMTEKSYKPCWAKSNTDCQPSHWQPLPAPPTHNSPPDAKASHNG